MSKKFWVALFPVFYRMFYVLLLTGVVIKGFGNYLGVRNLSGWHWLWAVIALLLLAWIDFGEIKGKMIGLVLLILCGTVVVPFAGVGKLEDFHANYFRWVIWGKDYVKDWITGYELMQVLWVVLGCYLFQVVSHKSRVVKELSALILLGLLILCMIKGIHIEQIGVALLIADAEIIPAQDGNIRHIDGHLKPIAFRTVHGKPFFTAVIKTQNRCFRFVVTANTQRQFGKTFHSTQGQPAPAVL